jgi:hypothetical protein
MKEWLTFLLRDQGASRAGCKEFKEIVSLHLRSNAPRESRWGRQGF